LRKNGTRHRIVDVGDFQVLCDRDPVDVCVCWSVFEHLPDPVREAKRICDLVKPGGVLVSYLGAWGAEPLHINFKQDEIKGVILENFEDLGGWVYRKKSGNNAQTI